MVIAATAACALPGGGRASVKNDLDAPVTVTLCPQQECGDGQAKVLQPGKKIKFRVADGDTPDSIVVLDEAGNKSCDLLSRGRRALISEARPSVC
jgi:hypothetical protein